MTPARAALGAVTEVAGVVATALVLSVVIKTFLVQAFYIPSQSMQDTLEVGDRVAVSKLTPGLTDLQRGDVVVFKDPGGWLDPVDVSGESALQRATVAALTFVGLLPQDSGEHLVKRVIGLPGDTVTCCDASGRLQVNGVSVDETYVRAGQAPSTLSFTVTLDEDRLWVMGDNRGASEDSRYHRDIDDGQVPVENVVGTVVAVLWPPGRIGGMPDGEEVFADVPDPS